MIDKIYDFILEKSKLIQLVLNGFIILFLFWVEYLLNKLTNTQNSSTLIALIIPLLNLIIIFAPNIFTFINRLFKDPKYKSYCTELIQVYKNFIKEYFLADVSLDKTNLLKDLTIINILELINDYLDIAFEIGPTRYTKKRIECRKQIILLIFILKYEDRFELEQDISVIIKFKYRKFESNEDSIAFFSCYSNIILLGKKFTNANEYFNLSSDANLEYIKMSFLDKYLKDDYISKLTEKMTITDTEKNKIKDTICLVAQSGSFNLQYLEYFIDLRKKYGKLFVIASKLALPSKIQTYIKSNLHFILRPSSINNIPNIGMSKMYDLFFFTPPTAIISVQRMKDVLISLDKSIESHPCKIYQIDPIIGYELGVSSDSEFFEMIHYFEEPTFKLSEKETYSRPQVLALLEENSISILDILKELDYALFSKFSFTDNEKRELDDIINSECGSVSISNILINSNSIKKSIDKAKKYINGYSKKEMYKIYHKEKIYLPDYRTHLLEIYSDIISNLKILEQYGLSLV